MDPLPSSFNRKEFSVACPLSSRSLLWTSVHGSLFVVWRQAWVLLLAHPQTFGRTRLWDSGSDHESPYLQAARCTWPAGGGGRLRGLTTPLFSPFDVQPLLSCSPWGGQRSRRSLSSGSALAAGSSGLQKNSYSLWHTSRHSIISFCPILSRVRSVFTGTCKITWQRATQSSGQDPCPQCPTNFYRPFCFIKVKRSLKRGPRFCAKGSVITECAAELRDDSIKTSKLLWPLGIKSNSHNMLKLLWPVGFAFFFPVLGQNCHLTVDSCSVWTVVFTVLPGRTQNKKTVRLPIKHLIWHLRWSG